MKTINNYIYEKLKLNKSVINKYQYTLFPKDRKELIDMIKNEIKEYGNECSLNHIDISNVTDLNHLFCMPGFGKYFGLDKFNGDITYWNMSNVINTDWMFTGSDFTGENSDLSKWDVSNLKSARWMFQLSKFNQNISTWKLRDDCKCYGIFYECKINSNYKPKFRAIKT